MIADSSYSSKNLSHLGVVAGMIDELNFVAEIDRLLGLCQSEQQLVSNGICVKSLILNGLGFSERRLYLVGDFFSDKPVEHLLGAEIKAEYLNDDRLGRCLDSLYAYGVSELFAHLSSHACKVLGLDKEAQFWHLDSTSFHVDGNYNSDLSEEEVGDCVRICMGYSRDKRPDLNQVMLNLVVENASGIPLQMQALSGNTSDKESFKTLINNHISNITADYSPVCWVADSALYTAETLKDISATQTWISRVPESIHEAKTVIKQVAKDQMLAFTTPELSKYRYTQVCSQYGGIKQEWLVVFSEDAYLRESQTLQKQYAKQSEMELKSFEKLGKETFTCEQDAQKALSSFEKTLKYCHIQSPQIVPIKGHKGSGRPKKGTETQIIAYQVQGFLTSQIANYQQLIKQKGFFIIASNDIHNRFSAEQKLLGYKGQSKVERGFRFLKDKQFLASTLFVKKPQRVEAILMIMSLSLLVYAALERKLHQGLKNQALTIPNQLNKQVQNPSMRWVFSLFKGIHSLYINDNDKHILLNINPLHLKTCEILGQYVSNYYKTE